jgi:hypothetical protein
MEKNKGESFGFFLCKLQTLTNCENPSSNPYKVVGLISPARKKSFDATGLIYCPCTVMI